MGSFPRLGPRIVQRAQASFSTSSPTTAKAHPVSKITLAQARWRRLFAANPQDVELPQPRSILFGVHGAIESKATFAAAATETSINVISEQFAIDCGLSITPWTGNRIPLLPTGDQEEPVGVTTAEWRFAPEANGSSSSITVDFVVLEDTSRPVILGDDVLRRSGTIGPRWRRLRSISTMAEEFSCIHMFGSVPYSITGTVDFEPVQALAATGCEINLVSEAFLEAHYSMKLKRQVARAEHSVKMINGDYIPIVHTVVLNWRYDDGFQNWPAEFVVVPDLQWDIVLGQRLLYGSAAFFNHAACLKSDRPSILAAGVGKVPFLLAAFGLSSSQSSGTSTTPVLDRWNKARDTVYGEETTMSTAADSAPGRDVAALNTPLDARSMAHDGLDSDSSISDGTDGFAMLSTSTGGASISGDGDTDSGSDCCGDD